MSGVGGRDADTVGSLLAGIATSLTESLRILMFADKRQWGPDEFEQLRALEGALDDAKKDFQEMAPLVKGQFYYQNDRTIESLVELQQLQLKFTAHAQNFKDWVRQGGPINPVWARETNTLKRELHRAQCRAARRIFAAEQEEPRCLGAFQVHRQQRRNERERRRRQLEQASLPPWQQQHERAVEDEAARQRGEVPGHDAARRTSLEELVPVCNAVGRFERLGGDAAFLCDFCDGFLVWPDLLRIPSTRTPLPPGSTYPNWQATGLTSGTAEDGQVGERGYVVSDADPETGGTAGSRNTSVGKEKQVVFPPLAIANHLPPEVNDWRARILCPYCDEYTYVDQGGDGGADDVKYTQDEKGFPDVEAFREHLEWYHTALPISLPTSTSNCRIM
ncbi:hypothetical protein B0T16DRAFT_454350 [Cercophora newfieldiana]|uniref:Uncharacterized protein n=1 Tax=Cercophora newfieldiana TaxID=92897 RepID=A0AA40CUJ1_9PEZI|nr:hypothetical protein B0T16DRAFT_454350 [Cercophora newfieldiana]